MLSFPEDPLELPRFKSFAGKKCTSLADAVKDPDTVKWLKLSGSLMSDIFPVKLPEELQQLSQLKILELENFPSIEWNYQLKNLPQLDTLICFGNQFAPGGLIVDEQLSQLKELYFELFYDIEIQESFLQNTSLKTLWIRESRVKGLEHLKKLTGLEELFLDIDNSADIPDLTSLPHLKRLNTGEEHA